MKPKTESEKSDLRAEREWQALGERVVRKIRERYAAMIDRFESQARDCESQKDRRE